jgi:hypothetical protein
MKILVAASVTISLLVSLSTACPATAQSGDVRSAIEALAGTFSVVATPMISSGKLTGCTVVFEHLQRDDLYLGGNFVKVSGSMGIMGSGDQIGFVMKAIANEFDAETMGSARVDLARIYLIAPGYRTNFDSLVDSYPSDVPGGIFSVFQFDPGTTMMLEAFSAGTATIAIGPRSGSSDIQLNLDLGVEATDENGGRTRSTRATTEFFDCAKRLISDSLNE